MLPGVGLQATLAKLKATTTTSASALAMTKRTMTTDKVQLYSERRVLGYSQRQMFKVVSQVEEYCHFVPWCKRSDIISRGDNGLKAQLVIGFPPLAGESYTSHVTFFEPHLVTAVCEDMHLLDHLKTVWKFSDGLDGNANSCTCEFAVSFQFKQSVHALFSKMFFDEVIKRNVKAFLQEATKRYGPESIPRQKPVIFAKQS